MLVVITLLTINNLLLMNLQRYGATVRCQQGHYCYPMPDDEASLAMTSRLNVFQSEMTQRVRSKKTNYCGVLYIKDPQIGIPTSVYDKLVSILIERGHPVA